MGTRQKKLVVIYYLNLLFLPDNFVRLKYLSFKELNKLFIIINEKKPYNINYIIGVS